MKGKLWKRILALVLAGSMMFGDSAIGFAEEYQSSGDGSYEIATSEMIITAGNEEKNGGGSEGAAALAFDGNENTIWHTEWHPKENNTHEDHWLQIELNNIYQVNGLKYLPRQGRSSNGIVTGYQILVSTDGQEWISVEEGTWAANKEWKEASFGAVEAKYVRFQVTSAESDQTNHEFASAAEIRLFATDIVSGGDSENSGNDINSSNEVPTKMYITTAGSTQSGSSADTAIDEQTDTFWEAAWDIGSENPEALWYQIELTKETSIEAVSYYPRWGSRAGESNGFITAYRIEVSNDGKTWTVAKEGRWEKTEGWKTAKFDDEIVTKYVRLIATETYSDVGNNLNMSIAEIRLMSNQSDFEDAEDKTEEDIELNEIDSKILAKNATANSEQLPAAWENDGGAAWAFDEELHGWHSRWMYYDQKGENEVSNGKPSSSNPIWIQTGFDESLSISHMTYLARKSGKGNIKKYTVSIANLNNPKATPTDSDFRVIKSGILECTTDVQTIKFDAAVEATHIRLTASSVYSGFGKDGTDLGDGYVAAQNIKVYTSDESITGHGNNGFTPEKDGWSFRNSKKGFNYSEEYSIPAERYREVFGLGYVAAAYANQNLFSSMMPKWKGSCYGMSVTSILFYHDMLDWNTYKGEFPFECVNDYRSTYDGFNTGLYTTVAQNNEIAKLIERYQILQYGTQEGYKKISSTRDELDSERYKIVTKSTDKAILYKHDPEGDYIQHLLNEIMKSKNPLMISMQVSGGGHAVVTRTDKEPLQVGEWYRVYVYDPNYPWIAQDIIANYGNNLAEYYSNEQDVYIELNPDLNQWRYCGKLNGDSAERYWGSDKNDKVLYIKRKHDNGVIEQYPEYIYAYEIQNINYPCSFDGTEDWLERWGDDIVVSFLLTADTNMVIDSADGTTICEIVDGAPIYYIAGVEYYPFEEVAEDGENGVSGRLTIPNDQFKIQYEEGSDFSILSNKNVMNIAASGGLTLSVDTGSGFVEIVGDKENQIITQITEIYDSSEYTSVVATGVLELGDTVNLQLKDDKLNAEITGDSEFELYTDNEKEPEERKIVDLDETDGKIVIEDVREKQDKEITRLYGSTRYETSYAIASALKKQLGVERFDTVILANGNNFPDALAGSYLASVKDAPILMARENHKDSLHEFIKNNLNVGGTIYVLGGTGAVPDSVLSGLSGYNVKRLSGQTRYETNLLILEEAGVTNEDILVCTGNAFADSLSASAVGKPILLLNNKKITEEQKAFLEEHVGNRYYIIGGTGAVNQEMENEIAKYGSVERVYGLTRYETSIRVAEKFFDNPENVVLAYAKNFPDGLCGGPLANKMNAPLVLTAEGKIDAAEAYVSEIVIQSGKVLGGDGVLPSDTVRTIFHLSKDTEI